MQNRFVRYAIGALASLVCTSGALAAVESFQLLNHPDAREEPPPYGLRLDNLFTQTPDSGSLANGEGGVTTFSFDPADGADVTLEVDSSDTNIVINIFGTVYGGIDAGSTYGFGEGLYDIDFTYNLNVSAVSGGWMVSPNNAENNGSITSQGNADVPAGTSWDFFDQVDNNNNTFKLLDDGHRLGGFPDIAALNPLVGRAWVTYNDDGSNSSGTQDFIFITPEPASLMTLLLGTALLARRR